MGKRSPSKVETNGTTEHIDEHESTKKAKFDVKDLLAKAEELAEELKYDFALKFCEKALVEEPENIKLLETVGNICAELGDIDNAKSYLLKAVGLQPNEGHVKYLYLGQLSEGTVAVEYYKTAVKIMTALVDQNTDNTTSVSNRDISNVYCSLAELYMTDCCMQDDAEDLCKVSCEKAVQLDEENPEAHLVMCNFLLTKGDMESAQNTANKLYDVWKSMTEKDGDNIVDLMSYESRMTLIKILIEVDLLDKVLSIGSQLLEENEDDIRIWYYIGLSKSLSNNADGQRYYIETALLLYKKHNICDEEMYSHLEELLSNCPIEEEEEQVGGEDETSTMEVDG